MAILTKIFKNKTGQKFNMPESRPSLKLGFFCIIMAAELFPAAACATMTSQTKNKKMAKTIRQEIKTKMMFKVSFLNKFPILAKVCQLKTPVPAILCQAGNMAWLGLALMLLNKISNSPPLPKRAAKMPNHQRYLWRQVKIQACFKIFR